MKSNFKNRIDAGEKIYQEIIHRQLSFDLIEAIPRGGVEIAFPIAKKIKIPTQIVFIRKLPHPFSPEMGFGSVDENKEVFMNAGTEFDEDLTEDIIEPIVTQVHQEVLRRKKEFSSFTPSLSLKAKKILLVDDGIATGASLKAAIHYLKSFEPEKVVVATGCGFQSSVESIEEECDEVICLIVQKSGPFAVASYYENFEDRSDEEIKGLLKEINQGWLKDKNLSHQ